MFQTICWKYKTKFRERYNNYKTKFRSYYNKKISNKLDKCETIPQAGLFEHFISHGNVTGFRGGKKKEENWGFWSFMLIDSSPNGNMLLERESFWQFKLQTFLPEGLNDREVSIINI